MALFKIFGNFASGNTTLPASTTQGYCYFDKNTGKFYIDTATSETAELGTNRLALNADKADKDGAGNNITDTYLTKVNGLTDVTFNTNNSIIYKTINGTTSPIVQIPILAGSGSKSAYGGGAIEPSKVNAFAFGLQAQADGVNSIALGASANTNSMHSISIGCRSSTTGVRSIAIGYAASTSSADAIAIGSGTLANSTKQMALGCYNIADTSSTYCLIVGNGTADDARSNALTVDWSGNTTIAGSLTLNGTTTITATDISNWNNSSVVSISPTLTSGTKIGTITIDGTSTDLYSETNTDTKVTQNAAITTSGAYPILLGNSTATTAITDTVNKTSTLTYNPSTRNLNVPSIMTDEISFNQGLEITNGHCILHLNEEIDQDTHRNKFVYEGNHYISMIDLNESFATIETNPYNGQNPGAYMCVYTDEVKAGLQDNSGGHLEIGSYGVSLIYGDPDSSSPHSYIRVTDDPIVEIESTLGIDLRAPNIYISKDSQVKITKLSLPNASNSNTYSSGTAGQVLTTNGTNVYWGTVLTEDTKVNVSTRGTTKAYLLADTTAPTSTATAHTAVAESDVYLDTTAGALAATTYKIAEAVTLQYNSTTQALDFIFA